MENLGRWSNCKSNDVSGLTTEEILDQALGWTSPLFFENDPLADCDFLIPNSVDLPGSIGAELLTIPENECMFVEKDPAGESHGSSPRYNAGEKRKHQDQSQTLRPCNERITRSRTIRQNKQNTQQGNENTRLEDWRQYDTIFDRGMTLTFGKSIGPSAGKDDPFPEGFCLEILPSQEYLDVFCSWDGPTYDEACLAPIPEVAPTDADCGPHPVSQLRGSFSISKGQITFSNQTYVKPKTSRKQVIKDAVFLKLGEGRQRRSHLASFWRDPDLEGALKALEACGKVVRFISGGHIMYELTNAGRHAFETTKPEYYMIKK